MPADERSRRLDLKVDQALERIIESTLASYSRVEPRPEAVEAWMRPPERTRNWLAWPMALPAGAWAAVVLALALLAALAFYRATHRPPAPARLANQRTVLVPVRPQSPQPMTDEQKRLLHLLETNPSALAAPNAKPEAPKTPHP